jgi:hypothetical protein
MKESAIREVDERIFLGFSVSKWSEFSNGV